MAKEYVLQSRAHEIKKFAKYSPGHVHDSVIVNCMTTEMHL